MKNRPGLYFSVLLRSVLFHGTYLLLSKTMVFGQVTFQKEIQTIGASTTWGREVVPDGSGGYAIAGYSRQSAAEQSLRFIKVDSLGNVVVDYVFRAGYARAFSLCHTSDSGFVLTGTVRDSNSQQLTCLLLKLNSSGDLVWAKKYFIGSPIFGTQGQSVIESSDGGYAIAGAIGTFLEHAFIIKTDANGNPIWQREYDFGGLTGIGTIVEADNGSFIVAGSATINSISDTAVYAFKVDSGGNFLWAKSYSAGGAQYWEYGDVVQASDGTFLISGIAAPNCKAFIKINNSGDLLWSKCLNVESPNAAATPDSGFVIGGDDSPLSGNVYLIKVDSSGNFVWSMYYNSGGSYLYLNSITCDEDGYIACIADNSILVNDQLFIMKVAPDGENCNGYNYLAISNPVTIHVDTPMINFSISGIADSIPLFNRSISNLNNTYCLSMNLNQEKVADQPFITPNPVGKELNLYFKEAEGRNVILTIYDMLGVKKIIKEIKTPGKIIDVSNFEPGLYFLGIQIGSEQYSAVFSKVNE